MRKIILAISFLICIQVQSQSILILKNGIEKQFKSLELIQEKYEKPYLKTEDGTVFRMEQIKSFQNKEGFFINNELTKNKNDFAERILHGRVSIFRYDLTGNFIQDGQNSQQQHFAYQKYDTPIKQMIVNNLERDLSDNSLAIKKLNKIKSAKRIAPLYYVLGGASILTAGIIFNTTESNLPTPLFLTGVGFFTIPFILNSNKQKKMDDAVKIYNAD